MHNINEKIVFLEKLQTSIVNYIPQVDKYYFNNKEFKNIAEKIIENSFILSEDNNIEDGIFSELFKLLFEKNSQDSFSKIIQIFEKYKRTYFGIYFYDDEQRDYFLSQATKYIRNKSIGIESFKNYLNKIDKELELIFKEYKPFKWNGNLPENIPGKFSGQIQMYEFFELNMDLEHLNREKDVTIDSLLYIILEHEANSRYFLSKNSFASIQSILDMAIKKDDIIMIDKILHTRNIKLNCFLLTQEKYYHFAFINLIKQFSTNYSIRDYELKIYRTVIEILISIYFEMYTRGDNPFKNDKLYFLITFIINWKNESQSIILELLQKELQSSDMISFINAGLERNNISLNYFLFISYEQTHYAEEKVLKNFSTSIIESFTQSCNNSFELHTFQDFDFKLLFKYTSIDNFILFCKDLNNIKDDANKYRFKDYFEVLLDLYSKDRESDIVNVVIGFAETNYGLNLDLVSKNKLISILNLFDMESFQIIIKDLNDVTDLLQIYSIVLDIKKKNIVSEKLDNIEIRIVSKSSAFFARQLGFEELSNIILKKLNDDELSKLVKCKTVLFDIYNDISLSIKDKHEKFNSYKFNNKNQLNRQDCQNYLSFLHTILNFEKSPEYVYKTLKKLYEKSPQHSYLVNLASAYIEFIKDDKFRVKKLNYLIEEFKLLILELNQNVIAEEYEILLYLYNETNNYIEFEKLWQSMDIVDTLSLNIVKLRVDFLIKKLQSTEAMKFLDEVENYYFDMDNLNDIKDLRVAIKSGAKNQLETIGMKFEKVIKEDIVYDVALSFAGEQRKYVEKVAKALKEYKINVFYDNYEKADMWGKDLYVHLDEIYSRKSKYTIIFISKEYEKKLWTNHERKSAQERAFREKEEYILPVIFDKIKIPGIRETTGYLDARTHSPDEVVEIFRRKFLG